MRRAAVKRHDDEHRRDVILAWNVERVAIMSLQSNGSRKLPALRKLLEERKGRPQTAAEQRAMLYALSGQLGQPLQRVRKGTDGRYHALN